VARHKLGDKVKARHHHDGVKPGTVGRVTKVSEGVYYGIAFPGVPGVCYSPESHVTPVASPTSPGTGGGSAPGGGAPGGGSAGGGGSSGGASGGGGGASSGGGAAGGGGAAAAAWEGLMGRLFKR
jgi:hypothetical protein